MKQEHARIREIVKELGEKQFDDHTRPIKYTKGYDDILEYVEQQERADKPAPTADRVLESLNILQTDAVEGLPETMETKVCQECIDEIRQYILAPCADKTLEIVKNLKDHIETEIFKFESIYGKERLWGITLAKNDLKLLEKIIKESEARK